MAPYASARDLRSDSTNSRRFRKRSAKYHKFTTTNEGQLAAPHKIIHVAYSVYSTLEPVFNDAPHHPHGRSEEEELIPALSKRQLYRIAKEGPARGWKYHARRDPWCRNELRKEMEERRGMKAGKKIAREWRAEWEDEMDVEAMWNEECVLCLCPDEGVWEHYEPEQLEPVKTVSFDTISTVKEAEERGANFAREMVDHLEWVDVWDNEFWMGDSEDDWSEIGDVDSLP
jgi:hypothetical protein